MEEKTLKKLKVAVIGVGFWGKNHLRVLNEIPQAEIVAVCDIDEERARTAAERYKVEYYTDSRKLHKEVDVDAVTICTWSTTLAKEAKRALKAGRHVLVEKPMASSVREAQEIAKIAEKEDLLLTVGFIERFNPAVRRAKQLIEQGKAGSVVSLTARRVSRWPERIGDVGVVKDTAIHDLDIARYIFGQDPAQVHAVAGRILHKRFEDYAHILLNFGNGQVAFIEANWLTPYKVRSLRITGSEAIITVDYITQELTIDTESQTIKPRNKWQEPLKLELQHFVDCILTGRKQEVTPEDGIKALKLAETALKSATKGKTIKLKWE
ncbi:MAG TPA: Gfo/Idh/MocA family oxidoreductase [Candidatus Bathyarchaeota archaeon]|nr:Gfo/Idh/MocA family oxidoreductase [Candidatus Bathyarchaeota archaeon]